MKSGDREAGSKIGRYVVLESVGVGAMGVVYGAYDPQLDRKVALKLLKPGQGNKEMGKARLLREAQAMARLSHPNVVAVHDVGVYEDQVFLAMEFLAAGTIKAWLKEKPRSWRDVLNVFIAAGRGLAAAHEAGIVHRDFKPENVLLDKDGRPRVVDFGIARQAEVRDDGRATLVGTGSDAKKIEPGTVDEADREARTAEAAEASARLKESSGNVAPLLTLTKTGTWVGTPAYMAPEQFLGERGDEKSDQFSFCVALYEALYGERPFAGDDMLSLSVSVTTEHFRPLPKDRGVPAWIRRVVLRGVKSDAMGRWPSMAALIAALEDDPAVKLRRRLVTGGTVALVAVVMLIAWQMVSRRRLEAEREISKHVEQGRASMAAAHDKAVAARDLRNRAFAAFDAMDRTGAEALWRQARALLPAIDTAYDQAGQALETGFALDRSRDQIKDELADVRYEHLLFAQEFRLEAKASIMLERLGAVDAGGARRKAFVAPGTVTLRTSPAPSRVTLERYERDPGTGRWNAKPAGGFEVASARATLPPGSYRFVVDGPNTARVVHPFQVHRNDQLAIDLTLPPASAVPDGFVYVAAGEFSFGESDEQQRTFLEAVPIHRRRTGAFLIARTETTYREWIAFLNAQPPRERARLAPNLSAALHGSLRLQQREDDWQLTFQPSTQRYSAALGEPIVYSGRAQRVQQDWQRFPVAGVSYQDFRSYTRWLETSGRVPGARPCTEVEWERAARGADDRLFPHGDELAVDDANFDLTYGRVDSAFGPDVVGGHPASRSPFGLDDMAGNLFELVSSSETAGGIVIRGGAFYYTSYVCRSSNRNTVPETFRDVTTGIRVCASVTSP